MIQHRLFSLGAFLLLILTVLPIHPALAESRTAKNISVSSVQLQALERITGESGGSYAAISADGRYVVYEAFHPETGSRDVYLYDRQTAQAETVSLGSNGLPEENPGDYSSPPVVSADGRFVAFMSLSSGLVSGDANGLPDIFIRDRSQGVTERVTTAHDGSPANGPSWNPAISADGRYAAFQSHASNLVQGDDNDSIDVFVRDRQSGVTELISVTSDGQQGTDDSIYGYSSVSISQDGRFVAFSYQNLPVNGGDVPGVYLRDRQNQTSQRIATGTSPTISATGQYLTFTSSDGLVPGDTNNEPDVYLYDRSQDHFERISVTTGGTSPAGQWIFGAASVSADGRYVVFSTTAALVPEDDNDLTDIYLRDRINGETRLVSEAADGQAGSGDSSNPAISANGNLIAFNSTATNLVPSGGSDRGNVFVRQMSTEFTSIPADERVFLPVMFSSH